MKRPNNKPIYWTIEVADLGVGITEITPPGMSKRRIQTWNARVTLTPMESRLGRMVPSKRATKKIGVCTVDKALVDLAGAGTQLQELTMVAGTALLEAVLGKIAR